MAKILDFELNILILGMIARAYGGGCGGPENPMRQWGAEMPLRAIVWKGDSWSAGTYKHEGKVGIQLMRHIGALNGGMKKERWFIPMEALHQVSVAMEGQRLD